MNKIIISNDISFQLDDKVKYNYETGFINKLKITIFKSTKLDIIYDNTDIKLDINIEVLDKQKLTLVEYKKNSKLKILSKINLGEKSILKLVKIVDGKIINSRNIINLNKNNASTSIILKAVNMDNSKYDFIINHNASNTSSNINTLGINYNGSLHFNITSYIDRKAFNCKSILNNRIINLSEKDAIIRPNLLVDNKADISNKSFIGLLDEEKNIDEKLVYEKLINENINKTLASKLSKYWR